MWNTYWTSASILNRAAYPLLLCFRHLAQVLRSRISPLLSFIPFPSFLFILIQHHVAYTLHTSFSNVRYQYQCCKDTYIFTLFNTKTSAFHTNGHGQIFLALSLKIEDVKYGVKLDDELRNAAFVRKIIEMLSSYNAKSSILIAECDTLIDTVDSTIMIICELALNSKFHK